MMLLYILLIPLALLALLHQIVRPKPTKFPIKNRHVFITGGSSGIGLALAHLCAFSGGLYVSILARNMAKLQEAQKAIRVATGIDVAVFSADVRDYVALKTIFNEAGLVDVLVCNQGVFVPGEIGEMGMNERDFMVDANFKVTLNLIDAALPGMKRRSDREPGSIVIMSSQAGQAGIYGYTACSGSKFALRGMAEALQQEVIADDIHVSLIFPPDTDTPRFAQETKLRPQLTSVIAGSSRAMTANEVAKKALAGIQSSSFLVFCNFQGLFLSIATADLSPQRSTLIASVEVTMMGVVRLAGLCFQCEKRHRQKK